MDSNRRCRARYHGIRSYGGIAVTLEKMRESVWMADNLLSQRVANGVEVRCRRTSASARAAVVAALMDLLNGMGQS